MEEKQKDYDILILTTYGDWHFVNVNQKMDTTKALGMLAKASHQIASSNKSFIDPRYTTFPVFITVDEDKAKKLTEMTDEEFNEYINQDEEL